MDIQKNSFYAPTSGCPSHQNASNFNNKNTTNFPLFNSGDIDSPQSSKNHHSSHAADGGDIDDHLGGKKHHSTQQPTDTKSTQNEDPRNFLAQLGGLFNNGSNSSQPQTPTDFTKFTQNQGSPNFLAQLGGLFNNGSNSSQPQTLTDFTKFTQNQGSPNFLAQLGGLFSNGSNSSQPQTQSIQHTDRNEKGPSPVNHSQPSSTTQNPPPPTTPANTNSPRSPASGHYASNLDEATKNTHVKFMPVVRGDEASENAKIHDQASFAKAVDKTALEYGLDPNLFRAQVEKESGAMRDYKKAMQLEGDLGRRSDNNTSIGIGQISRKFLDGREWSDGGPNNERVGGKTVTTEMYNNSTITQLRVAASNLAMRIQDHGNGDLKKGLNLYVSGHAETDSHNIDYTRGINEIMQNKELMNIGR